MLRPKVVGVTSLLLSLGAAMLLALDANSASRGPVQAERGYAAEVSIAPMPGSEGAYLCRAKVQDLRGGEVVFAPRLSFRKGEPVHSESSGPAPGQTFIFEVSVDGTAATYTLEVRQGETVVSRHKASVALQAG